MEVKIPLADLYTTDQREPPGRFQELERAFWETNRHLIRALLLEYGENVVQKYEAQLTEFPDMLRFIENIALEAARDCAEKAGVE